MVAISTLLVVVTVSLLVTRVATVILTATGMSREAARFQARSAFSGSGFTTRESETVVDHPIRRRVIATLMLLGSAGTVAVISTLILGLGKGGGAQRSWKILELALGLLAIVYLSRSRWLDQRLTRAIRAVLRRYTKLPTRDLASLLDLAEDYAVGELAVSAGEWLADRSLADLGLRDEGIVVLGLTRPDGRYLAAPTGATPVRGGDILVAYGRAEQLRELDDRQAGPDGDAAHAAAIARQERLERDELSPA